MQIVPILRCGLVIWFESPIALQTALPATGLEIGFLVRNLHPDELTLRRDCILNSASETMIQTSVFQRLFCICSALGFGAAISDSLRAQVRHDGLTDLGLVVNWEANIGGAPLNNGRSSFVVWPHSTAKREHVTVRLGNRVIAQIAGDEIDNAALEKAIIRGERPKESPKLGLKGATEKAEKLVATYKTLGRSASVESFSQNLTYVVTLATNGILEAIDAESGAVLWQVEAGDATLPMFGPGVSDEHVVITNGNFLQIYDLATGNLINTRQLQYSPTGCPTAMPGKAIVPSILGRTVAYDIAAIKVAPVVLRTGTENRLGTTMSADREFLAWPMQSKLILAKLEREPRLWTSVSFGETLASLPVATQNGFVASTNNGTVFHCNTLRNDSLQWKHRLAVQITKSPVVSKDIVVVVSDDGLMFALKLTDGSEAWEDPVLNINEILSIGKKHVYVRTTSGTLAAYDVATGHEVSRSSIIVPEVIPNSISDRVFIINKNGQLSCLREVDAVEPTFVTTYGVKADESKATEVEQEDTKPAEEDSSMFGDEDSSPAADSGDDPFATDTP